MKSGVKYIDAEDYTPTLTEATYRSILITKLLPFLHEWFPGLDCRYEMKSMESYLI